MTVLAAGSWRTNGEMIADVAKLYIKPNDFVLDPTYGKGLWWAEIEKPLSFKLRARDRKLRPEWDFTQMVEFNDNTFDVVAFDPPYVSIGGRNNHGMDDMHEAFDMKRTPKTPLDLQREVINMGMLASKRVLKPQGYLFVKCQDYISSGKFFDGTFLTQWHAKTVLDLVQVDRFEFVTPKPRPQPKRDRQVHARRNVSTLLVFQKRKPSAR